MVKDLVFRSSKQSNHYSNRQRSANIPQVNSFQEKKIWVFTTEDNLFRINSIIAQKIIR